MGKENVWKRSLKGWSLKGRVHVVVEGPERGTTCSIESPTESE